jgi:hypothetical protein
VKHTAQALAPAVALAAALTTLTALATLGAGPAQAAVSAQAPAQAPAQAAAAQASGIPRFPVPAPYGTSFQPDPHHDFTKHISSRHDGILRGLVTSYSGGSAGVAEYVPIRWKKGGLNDGHFVTPPEGDATAYASPVWSKALLYATVNCTGTPELKVDKRGLGLAKCSHKDLVAWLRRGGTPALITVYKGRIVRIQEIYHP